MQFIIFILALSVLLFASRQFTKAAVKVGEWMKLPNFVVGIFIVGIGTSLPELVSGILAVQAGSSEILSANIIGSNISNLLLVTGLAVALNRKSITLGSQYIYTDLHFLIGSFFVFYLIAYDGQIEFKEALFGPIIFIFYSFYLIKGETNPAIQKTKTVNLSKTPYLAFLILILSAIGIYFGADYTIISLKQIAGELNVPDSIVSLTVLSLGTTLPELSVNISAIKQGNPEMAIGNILGSCVFNTLIVPFGASLFGSIALSNELTSFSLPVMAASGLFFYLLTHDKKISPWEGILFVIVYTMVIFKIVS
ncbi:MAG: sodium:calcium antiporter [Bacteroidia bacterium]